MNFFQKLVKYGYEFCVDNMISKIFLFCPIRNTIFFESVPSCSDSPKAIFDELVKRGYNQKYKMVWWLYDDEYKPEDQLPNVLYLNSKNHRMVRKYYEYSSKCLICSNRFLEKHQKKQKAFYIIHGSPLKRTEGYYPFPNKIDYYFGASEHLSEVLSKQLSAPIEKEIDLGLPRNDELLSGQVDLRSIFNYDYKRIIAWYPTFRQHKTGVQTGCKNAFPLIYDSKVAEELNEYAKSRKVLIVIKPHFAQDLSVFTPAELSNILFINDDFLKKNKLTSYKFINSCDALISDYSSIYYDFLLCNKPIALVWEDIEQYRTNPGFSVDIDYYCKGAEKVYDILDLKKFIKQVTEDEDRLKIERKEICQLVNYSVDGKNTERVTNKIIELARL